MFEKLRMKYNQKKNDRTFLLSLSLSLLLCGIFISLLAFFVDENSYSYNFRTAAGSVLIFLWLSSFPYFTKEMRDKICNKVISLLLNTFLLCVTIFYWLKSISSNKTSLFYDLIFIIATIFVVYHLVSFIVVIFRSILRVVKKIFNYFSMDEQNRFIKFLGNITAAIIAISSLIIAIASLTNTIKTLFIKNN